MGLFSGLENMIESPLKAVEGLATELNPMNLLQEGMSLFGGGAGAGGESASSFLPNMSIVDGSSGGGGDLLGGGGGGGSSGGGDGLLSLVGDAASIFSFL